MALKKQQKNKFVKWLKRTVLVLATAALVLIIFLLFSFSKLLVFLPDSFSLMGFPFQAKNYLLVAQNNAELRPTGGFASAYALVQFRSGKVHIELHDVYGAVDDHPFVEPPYPYGELLANEGYTGHSFRDANVYANFPASAEEFIRFFNITKPDVKIDGVVAVNYDILEDMVGVLGEIEVEGKQLTEANLFETIEHEVNNIDRHDIEQIYSRKQFLQPVLYALVKKSILNPGQWRKMSNAVYQALNDKKIQLYFKDEELQQKYTDKGWGGVWPQQPEGDFFAVVDTNLGGMKSNRYIVREVSRLLNFTEKENAQMQLSSDVDVKISHLGVNYIPLSGDYSGFIRFYTPDGSDFMGPAPAEMWRYFENGYTVFAKKIELKPGENTKVTFSYSLPDNIFSGTKYQLNVPRQSSTDDFYSLIFRAPRGFGLAAESLDTKENVAAWRQNLHQDLQISLQLKSDTLPPLVIFQKILDYQTATIHFNESVKGPINLENWELIDLNFNNQQTDQAKVVKAEIDPVDARIVILTIDGLTEQVEERYKLRLRDIEDIHGNKMNPTEITLIQRNLAWIK